MAITSASTPAATSASGRRDGPGAEGGGELAGAGLVGVAQRQRANAGQARECSRVERADPSDADQPDVKGVAKRLRRGGAHE